MHTVAAFTEPFKIERVTVASEVTGVVDVSIAGAVKLDELTSPPPQPDKKRDRTAADAATPERGNFVI